MFEKEYRTASLALAKKAFCSGLTRFADLLFLNLYFYIFTSIGSGLVVQ